MIAIFIDDRHSLPVKLLTHSGTACFSWGLIRRSMSQPWRQRRLCCQSVSRLLARADRPALPAAAPPPCLWTVLLLFDMWNATMQLSGTVLLSFQFGTSPKKSAGSFLRQESDIRLFSDLCYIFFTSKNPGVHVSCVCLLKTNSICNRSVFLLVFPAGVLSNWTHSLGNREQTNYHFLLFCFYIPSLLPFFSNTGLHPYTLFCSLSCCRPAMWSLVPPEIPSSHPFTTLIIPPFLFPSIIPLLWASVPPTSFLLSFMSTSVGA